MDKLQEAYKKALEARENAHAPYSKFHVGCALKARGTDQIFVGCNVENASFGGTICAERTAITSLVASRGKAVIEWILVVTDTSPPVSPCGICRQVLAEFGEEKTTVYLADLEGVKKETTLGELLPMAFTKF